MAFILLAHVSSNAKTAKFNPSPRQNHARQNTLGAPRLCRSFHLLRRQACLLAWLFLCLSTAAFGTSTTGPAITYVQGNYATPQGSQSTVSIKYKAAQTAGDLNVVVVGWNDTTATVKSVTDSAGNAYALAIGPTLVSGSLSQSIYFARNIVSASANTVTVTFSASASYADVRVLEYAGADPVNPVDVAGAKTGTSSPSSASAVTTNPTDLLFAANIVQTSTNGAGSGFTKRLLTQPDGDIVEDEMAQAAGTYTTTAPLSSSGSWIMQVVAFRTPSGSNGGLVTPTALSCTTSSMTGAGTDACTVTLNATPSASLTVSLASNNASVVVPASMTVPAGATTANFTATLSAVSTAQTATLTASANNVSQAFALQLNAVVPTLTINPTSLNFGNVNVNSVATQTITLSSTGTAAVSISSAALTGSGFSMSGTTFPLTLNPSQTATLTVQFDPTVAGAVTGQLLIASNSSTGASTSINLSGTGIPTLKGLSCTNATMSGAGNDTCTVTLSAAAAGGGFVANLASNSPTVTLPATITVPASAASAAFSVTVASFSNSQTATITASAGGIAETFALQLNAVVPTLNVSPSSLSFNTVTVGTSATQGVTLSSTGTAPVVIDSASVSGAGFSISGFTFPLTLNPGDTTTLTVQFSPSTLGSVTGQLAIVSNSSTNGTFSINLSGSAVPALAAISCAPSSLAPGTSSTCTITLNQAAPTNGSSINLVSNSASLSVPAAITVAAGSTSASFTATAGSFGSSQSVNITASLNGISQVAAINLVLSSTINYVQGGYATPQGAQSTVSVQYSAAQAAGDLNVVVVGWNDTTATVKSVTDSAGNAYALAVGPTLVSGALSQSIYFARNIVSAAAGANTVTVTFSASASYADVRVLEYNGADPVNPVDVAGAKTGTSSPSSASITTTNPTGLLFAANIVQTSTNGAGSGFTQRLLTQPDGDIAEDQMVQAAGAYSATAALSSSGSWIMQMVAFRTPSGASPAQVVPAAISCANASMNTAGTDACTVTLNAAPAASLTVSLASNNASVVVPASITVPAGATAASFAATVSAVSTAQTVTLTASADGATQAFVLQLSPATATLSINATNIAFGNVNVNTTATQTVTLTSTGGVAVTVSSAAISGTGFSISGATFPMTLNPGQSATLNVQFDPTATGTANGQLNISSNSTTNPTVSIGLSGTGEAMSTISLTWNAPASSPDPVASYNIYRCVSGSSTYTLITTVSNDQLAYSDNNVPGGQTYDYIVESVDASGVESTPSNMATVSIP